MAKIVCGDIIYTLKLQSLLTWDVLIRFMMRFL